jgi:hypothetical protein
MSIESTTPFEKKHKKLAIQVSLSGLSFCCFNTLNNTISSFNEVVFGSFHKGIKIEELFADAFNNNPELNDSYDDVIIVHSNNLSTFVPDNLFDEQYLGSYLQYTTKVFETDFFAFDKISSYEMNCVYIP